MYKTLRKVAFWTAVAGIFIVAAEVTARLDDWCEEGTPVLANPNRALDLTIHDAEGLRGRPHGHFRKWRLNAFGFRGPEMTVAAPAGRTRVMVLGASESFGLYESPGKEYPARLAELLTAAGDYEVVNASLAGLTVKNMVPYWEKSLAQFHPDLVVIYPSPLFYLDDPPPAPLKPPGPNDPHTLGPQPNSRFAARLRDVYHTLPSWIKYAREEWEIGRHTVGKGEDWYFRAPPAERIDLFLADLGELTAAVRKSGAVPLLLTHANRAASPPRPEDLDDGHTMRRFFPRATVETILGFEQTAARATIEFCRKNNVAFADIASEMDGKRELFADLVHFTDDGAAAIAGLIAERVKELSPALTASRCDLGAGRE